MFDKKINQQLHPLLNKIIFKALITPTQMTLLGFALGIIAFGLIVWEYYYYALIFILLNRICDGLDGAIARKFKLISASGSYLDIVLDFLFYSGIILAFALANTEKNALMATFLIFSFIGTGSSFLARSSLFEKYQIKDELLFGVKGIQYIGGLTEGFETIVFLCLICLFPDYFFVLAGIFGALCLITTVYRILITYFTLKQKVN